MINEILTVTLVPSGSFRFNGFDSLKIHCFNSDRPHKATTNTSVNVNTTIGRLTYEKGTTIQKKKKGGEEWKNQWWCCLTCFFLYIYKKPAESISYGPHLPSVIELPREQHSNVIVVEEGPLRLHTHTELVTDPNHATHAETARRKALLDDQAAERRDRRQRAAGVWQRRQPIDLVDQLSSPRRSRPVRLPLTGVPSRLWGSGGQLSLSPNSRVRRTLCCFFCCSFFHIILLFKLITLILYFYSHLILFSYVLLICRKSLLMNMLSLASTVVCANRKKLHFYVVCRRRVVVLCGMC